MDKWGDVLAFTQLIQALVTDTTVFKEELFQFLAIFWVRDRVQSFIADEFPTHIEVQLL